MPHARLRSAALLFVFCAAGAGAAEAPPLERIMADPEWIGPPVEAAWWQLDGRSVVYRVERPGTDRRDLHRVTLDAGADERLAPAAQTAIDGADPVLDEDGERALFLREGSLYLRHLDSGELQALTAGAPAASRPAFSADGRAVHYQRDDAWLRHDLDTGVARRVADLRTEDSPLEADEDSLEPDQLRLFSTLAGEREEARAAHEEAIEAARVDPARAVPPFYLGDEHQVKESALSPDGRWLLLVVEKGKESEPPGKADSMPEFVHTSGYVEIEEVRRLVGRDAPRPQALWLLDLATRTRHDLGLTALSGRDDDPLADLKAAQDIEPHDAEDPRPVRVTRIDWHPRGGVAAVMFRAVDNKDRWIATVDTEDGAPPALVERHRLTDAAWVSWAFNEMGWMPEGRELWFLSEESGHGHLYRAPLDGRVRRVTKGDFEVSRVTLARDGRSAVVLANRTHPTEYDLWSVDLGDGAMRRLTRLLGVEDYARHPITGDIAVRHSEPYVPIQLSVLDVSSGDLAGLTDTRTEAYASLDWQAPEFVGIPSRHGVDAPLWTKFYPARGPAPDGGEHPAVVFVHGAGYTQNTHHRFPYYFREQMFHNLLTARGYHVIDMDYRASRGYGRDWRTAIYRRMGTPELEDLVDGVAWLVEEHDADPARIGVYGGSYGGFMTFMALFNAPDTFAAGAALRPVTDWAHYNHGYTSNILNTPQVDPEAYRRSSPIEFVEGLEGDLLVSHGMLDDNVFYKDSVRLAQRLIELGKTDWEMASYPLEPHGYVHPEAWLDQYRRVLELFEATIGSQAP